MNTPIWRVVWKWYAMAFAVLYLMTTFAAASLEAVSRQWMPFYRRIAADLSGLVPGSWLWAWLDWDAMGPAVGFVGALVLALPLAYAIWRIQSIRAALSRRRAVIEDEQLRERTRQRMRNNRRPD